MNGQGWDGRRRNSPRRWISQRSDEAIKDGSRKKVCRLCQHTASRKKMHIHFLQHYTKYICTCWYKGVSYDSVYCHQRNGSCSTPTQGIHKVDKNKRPVLPGPHRTVAERKLTTFSISLIHVVSGYFIICIHHISE